MRQILLFIGALALSACSMEGMVEKAVPEDVRADHMMHVDQLLAKDTSRIEAAFDIDPENEDAQKQLAIIIDNVPDGAEIRRDYVGVNSAVSTSLSEGKTRDIKLTTEVQTEGGFMTVVSDYALDAQGNCCVLTNINVAKADTSPARQMLETLGKVARIVGIVFLILILGIILFFVRHRRKKKAAASA